MNIMREYIMKEGLGDLLKKARSLKLLTKKSIPEKSPHAVDKDVSDRLMAISLGRFNNGGYFLNHSTHSYR